MIMHNETVVVVQKASITQVTHLFAWEN